MAKAPAHRPPGCGLVLDRTNASYYGKRGGRRRASHTIFIDGEWVTYDEAVSRSGLTKGQLYYRMQKLKEAGEIVTWKSLDVETAVPFTAPSKV